MFCFDPKEFPKGIGVSMHFSPQAQKNDALSERGCVVLDQPQRLDRARRLRLVFDTAAG
jgi:hypothetical protein